MVEKNEYIEKYGFYQDVKYDEFPKGLSEDVIRKISKLKNEPEWMLQKRLTALKIFESKPMPMWGADLSKIKFEDYYYYRTPNAGEANKWENVPDDIKQTFDKLGVPEAERKFFAGAEAQFDSSVVYSHINEELEKLGIVFTDTDTAVRKYPELMKKYWGTIIPPTDNKFAALNTATWSGGSFIYVPKGVKVPMPLNAYFRINAKNSGQFERTLIIADEGADVTYIEGCTSPVYTSNALHSAVVELVALEGAHIRYVTIQNWSKNVYNLVTQRAHVAKNGKVEWIDANIGSMINMKYPSIFLQGEGAQGEVLSVALAGEGQTQDSGGKIYHLASNTRSKIISKSVSKGSGVTTFRGLLHVAKNAENVKSHVSCDALLLDEDAKTNTFPYNQINRNDAVISHEAKVGKISDDEIFYLMSRGISEDDATAMIVLGFIDDLTKVLPVEYSLELKRLIKLDTSKGVG
ncbi:MAG: Fe-S cluster assembly protein SufB [Candidatus Micrarchaeota archaeon]|nr:Fe-S cluster assembly protein SufB [Candidatus Micrarchaeota archaeon]MDE1834511.1 Fe-S cluster assembly protein SufB [Candidatus Micrarchaeota archaeon]MDE1859287.1 Fe-S cluster assembly protein SufB [Candidatus Micrarchaeota archaeon]